ncbi:MAG: 50S ribosomal protein L3 [Deltaproteobacteria bacterium]|nr:50S ribosomal protein L3 [Deltaproteobacteria bacterium]MCB9479024.1 50S ribosomal protein L3 [Deltaproteobacteria bacterium]
MKAIVGKKLGMTQTFEESGRCVGLTVVEATPGVVVRVNSGEDGDSAGAIQVGFFETDPLKLNRPDAGQFKNLPGKKAGYKVLREFRVADAGQYKVGQEITVEQFAAGDLVDVQGRSIGKGWAGTIKRHNFARGPMTHGSKNKREPGSIGMSATPSRVHKGKRMAGQMGNKTATVQRLAVYKVDPEKNLIFIIGGVPGSRNGVVTIKETVKPRRAEA